MVDTLNFSFSANPKVIFGPGKIKLLPAIVGEIGNNVLLVIGEGSFKASSVYKWLMTEFEKNQIYSEEVNVVGEPSVDFIDEISSIYRDKSFHVVVSIGGGSVIDAGKAISAMIPQNDSVLNYIDGIGKKKHNGIKVPFIAVPTTAGTGSEATKNAVLSKVGKSGFKKSLRHDNFIPDVAIIDPELTLTCPPEVTATSGLDAFTQLLESYTSRNAFLVTDSLALPAIELFGENFLSVCMNDGSNIQKRSALSYAAYISGLTLSNAGLGTVHGLASVIGGYFSIPHGVICGTLLGEVISKNIEILFKKGDRNSPYLMKYARVGNTLSREKIDKTESLADIEKNCENLISIIKEWIEKLQIPGLGYYGIRKADLERIARETDNKSNPVHLTYEDILDILLKRL